MISYLDKMGKKDGSVGIISINDKSTTNQREQGFRDALAKSRLYD